MSRHEEDLRWRVELSRFPIPFRRSSCLTLMLLSLPFKGFALRG